MRIAIETLGTRGDVQPYLALSRGLMARGHEVQLAGPVQFQDFAAGHGVPFVGLPGEFLALMDTPEGKAAIAGGEGFAAGFKLLKYVRPLMRKLLDSEWAAVRDFQPDVVVYHPKSLGSPGMATALGVPHVLASPLPGFTATSAFPSPLLPFASLGPLNRASHSLAIHGAGLLFGKDLRRWREDNGIGAKQRPVPAAGTLYAYSPAVLPSPADWGRDVLVSGYWFLDSPEWTPDDRLAAFLRAGDAPAYVGFGSMPGLDPGELALVMAEALRRVGKRGVFASGGGALAGAALPAHVHFIAGAPHDRLLPMMSATIHHGGAGTTAASLRAGLPTTIMPFFGDQPFWARRVEDLGVGPAPLNRKTLTIYAPATALVAMDDPTMRSRADALGRAIRAEHGVAAAIEFIEQLVQLG
jgi:UDP:flavonoid glycosyltransferase YjiC (YdhE family)